MATAAKRKATGPVEAVSSPAAGGNEALRTVLTALHRCVEELRQPAEAVSFSIDWDKIRCPAGGAASLSAALQRQVSSLQAVLSQLQESVSVAGEAAAGVDKTKSTAGTAKNPGSTAGTAKSPAGPASTTGTTKSTAGTVKITAGTAKTPASSTGTTKSPGSTAKNTTSTTATTKSTAGTVKSSASTTGTAKNLCSTANNPASTTGTEKSTAGTIKNPVTTAGTAKNPATATSVSAATAISAAPLQSRHVTNPEAIQIQAGKSEIDRRIWAFMERKQGEINENNIREFCNVIDGNQENSCARTDAVFTSYPGFKSHMKVSRVVNAYGPQTRSSGPASPGRRAHPAQRDCGNQAVEERLQNMECHLQLPTRGPVPRDIYHRIKRLEDRILELEGISPEYFQSLEMSNKRKRAQLQSRKYSLVELDQKMNALRQSLIQRTDK